MHKVNHKSRYDKPITTNSHEYLRTYFEARAEYIKRLPADKLNEVLEIIIAVLNKKTYPCLLKSKTFFVVLRLLTDHI